MEESKKDFERVSIENGLDLTGEQIQIAVLLDHGYSQEEIAVKIGCCQKTVSNKIAQIKNKLLKQASFCGLVYRGTNEAK